MASKILSVSELRRASKLPATSSAYPSFSATTSISPIREFEQQGYDASTRIPVQDHLEAEGQRVRAELEELERELAIMRQGPFGPQSEFMQSLPSDEREALLKALEDEGVMPPEDPELITDEELEELAKAEQGIERTASSTSPLKVTLGIPYKDKIYVKRFNAALKEAQSPGADDKTYFALWKWYLRCQQHVSNFSVILPEDVWHFLWKSQSSKYYRPKHLQMLGGDMIKVDVPLEDSEWLGYIDALHANGDIAAATETWEAQRSRLGVKEDIAKMFWTMGVRLYVDLGRPRKAQSLAFECYEHTTMIDPEVFVSVISAWAKSQSPSAANNAWLCYLELRRRLENTEDHQTTLAILGRISSALLHAGRKDLALAIFKDMFMLTVRSPTDSWRIFQQLAKESKVPPSPSEDFINQIGLTSLVVLPRSFQNKYFFAAWIKWLLGESKADEAALVVELMYERGVKPDARHLNGIVAAWLREGSPGARRKAENTAWAMIQSRIELVQKRLSPTTPTESSKSERFIETTRIPFFLRRGAPPATIETFSILLLHYTRRSDFVKASHLTNVMTTSAQIKPNSFIMNHWLYASLRSGKIPDVWKKYSTLKKTIPPDLETFAALWDTAKTHYGSPAAHNKEYPDGRTLFAEMQEWFQALDPKKKSTAQADFSSDFYEQIIRCFCLSSDPQGTLCALYGLRESFNMLPHEEVVRLVIMQIARSFPSDFVSPSSRAKGVRRMKSSRYQSAVKSLAEIVLAMTDKKMHEKGIRPSDVEEIESRPAQELRLDVLTSFLCMVIERRLRMGVSLADDVSLVAQEMKTSVPPEVLVHRDWSDTEL
ncbi:uncharacterized protein Z518_09501 [Rhinocladiella mackenziei CBS 650.93]|uniref:Rhinocladiella mackenziei CBS 650.93 unplaced genomic scaffold supercont1.7, whole genome shotgun sequence n=1 Tax=Rhinocladiella mackenziei CBS 650.93 TaxID=1442369 RepID=A0A0D2I7F2_9EURO|nr:uncharacterized protein Z518_09501 [Rhinocladiella mackenziei CBS 650.93]KIX01774.1 hypothetical protein Z518_09501 [Rhinocladiella mackenziei CBS 650.93]